MDHLRTRLDPWPLLPRAPGQWNGRRPVDEPARGAFDAMAGLAAALLLLRWGLPESALSHVFAAQLALWGGLGGMAVTAAILALTAGAALAMPLLAAMRPLQQAALRAFDAAVHLGLVLSCAGLLGALVLYGHVSMPAMCFAGQAALLLLCHRTRIWLAGEREA